MNAAQGDDLRDDLRSVVEAPPTRIVVIGGGMAGLVAARDCARPGFSVTLLEASDAFGGSVAALDVGGITVDAGAESFATRGGHVAALIEELGLSGDVVQPNPAGAWVRYGSRTVPLPKAGLLGIPSSPLASDVVAAIGWGGALRAYLDRLMPVLTIGKEKRLGTLVRKRMGAKVLDRLVAPVATGVYSAQPDDLDVDVVAPGLNNALTRLGSLSGAVGELRANAKAGSAVGGIDGGMWRLPAALASAIAEHGGVLRTGAQVVSVEPWVAPDPESAETDDTTRQGADPAQTDAAAEAADALPARWTVRLADGEELPADAVILATPAPAALALLATASPELARLSELDWPPASSVELVTLVLTDQRLSSAPRGTGVLVSDAERSDVSAKAMTHSTAKWAWLAQAVGAGRHVVRLSYGRAGTSSETAGLDDAALRALAVSDASTLLDIPLTESEVAAFARTRWTNALPYAALGEGARIAAVREAADAVEGLEVTGSWLTGTGLASVVPDARHSAERARGLRWKALTENL
ncbi:FAD-dependent oxidoreductase [Leifsonia sp. PS1209]|uniref:protoporphyrinogen/coproporphyrinogen oxidase n=1 Tax=Leifsonia sp. PS1209 TaxID=2724914 RepID=UPI001442E388|nr:FAD-dependent oxidoreductase [Leifsonia sp. PS1209]QIZ97251.1 NAD(P)-binding protein [Leifsonia sp. PS1209]